LKYMLDTNILIYILKTKPPKVFQRLNEVQETDELCMSFVTFAELLKGVQRSQRKEQTLLTLDRLTRQIPVVFGTNRQVCLEYAEHFSRLKTAGTQIGGNDLWIACHALAENATLVTNNISEFQKIERLRLDNWAE
jgi:tRNA(fMet)-specific endonuclease VapC